MSITCRTLAILVVLFAASPVLALDPAAKAIPASLVSVDAPTLALTLIELEKQTGIKVSAGSLDPAMPIAMPLRKVPFWSALEAIAANSGSRIVTSKQGKQIAFAKKEAENRSSIDGAFRFVPKNVSARTDLERGRTYYDLTLDIQWEPRFPVFRIDSQPKIRTATDDKGTALTSPAISAKSPTTGSAHTTTIRIDGLTRNARTIARLEGEFIVTASPKMLAFEFDDLQAKLPIVKERDGVKVTLKSFAKIEDRWDVELHLEYPASHPEFESFESWATGNAIRLIAPNAGNSYAEDNYDITGSGRSVVAAYRFKDATIGQRDPTKAKGWKIVYETPAPLIEFPIRFDCKDIPLP